MISVYIHIPFCDKICSYCDFCKLFYNENFVDRYLEALKKEILTLYKGELVNTIYIGGGTPSCLNIEQLIRLFEITKIFNKSLDCEFTIEGNFESTTHEKLDLYKNYGVNRLSFGIESIDDGNLSILERNISIKNVTDIIEYSKKIGLTNVNVDLIYAIPGEDLDILMKDINYILSLDVPHISTYSLIIEDNTKLKIKGIKNISEDLDNDMYKLICEVLKSKGYKHYEISNFAKEGYESRHNTCYWDNEHYYGFGLGASSYLENVRKNNTRSINRYFINEYGNDVEVLSWHDEIEYQVILNLRKSDGINLELFKNRFGINLIEVYDYKELLKNGLLVLKNEHLFIPEDKWYISNGIIVDVLERKVK